MARMSEFRKNTDKQIFCSSMTFSSLAVRKVHRKNFSILSMLFMTPTSRSFLHPTVRQRKLKPLTTDFVQDLSPTSLPMFSRLMVKQELLSLKERQSFSISTFQMRFASTLLLKSRLIFVSLRAQLKN